MVFGMSSQNIKAKEGILNIQKQKDGLANSGLFTIATKNLYLRLNIVATNTTPHLTKNLQKEKLLKIFL